MADAPSAAADRLLSSALHISPMIWRRVVVPADPALHGLDRVFQIAFGREDHRPHAFHAGGRRHGTGWTGQRRYRRDDDPSPRYDPASFDRRAVSTELGREFGSNPAIPASTVASIRPCGVERSKAIPLSATRETRRASSSRSVVSRSAVLRPQRDSSRSPAPRRSPVAAPAP